MDVNSKFVFIVCTYNNKDIILDCINSINNLNMKEGWGKLVIVVDDNSTDNTLGLLEKKKLITVKMYENVGPSKCRNEGIKALFDLCNLANYFVFLDSDVILDKNFLIETVSKMEKENAAIAGPKLVLPDNSINSLGGSLSRVGIGSDSIKQPNHCMYICSAAMLVKSDLFNKIGNFDETYFYGHEDTDFGWRANLAGYKTICVPTTLAIHKKSQTVSKNVGKIYYHAVKNRARSLIKNYSIHNVFIYLPLYTILMIGDILVRPYKKEKMAGLWWFFTHMKDHLKERKKVQATRKVKDNELPFAGVLP